MTEETKLDFDVQEAMDHIKLGHSISAKEAVALVRYRVMEERERCARVLENDALTHEVLHLGGQYRSDYGRCEYWHTSYKRVA